MELYVKPKERVLLALAHREADRVPVDFAATTVTGITYPAYRNLRAFLGLETEKEIPISHIHQGTAVPGEDVLQVYESDFRTLFMKKSPRGYVVREAEEGFDDEYNIRWRKVDYDYSPVSSPLQECSVDQLDSVQWPDPYDSSRVEGVREEALRLREETEFALVADIMCRGPFELAVKLRGYEQFLTDLHLDVPFVEALLNKITDTIIGLWDVYLSALGDCVEVVCQGDDIGTQTGLYISPQMYRKFFKPCHRRIYEFIHSRTSAKVFMHTCGSIYDVIPDLIEIGVDILNPIQRNAAKMDIATLKSTFGKDLCLWGGGIDVQQKLPGASLQEIEDDIKRTLDIMAPGGGYVFVPTHNLQPDISAEQIDCVYRSVLKHGNY
jgi:uroporphyrinogen decarboxylase